MKKKSSASDRDLVKTLFYPKAFLGKGCLLVCFQNERVLNIYHSHLFSYFSCIMLILGNSVFEHVTVHITSSIKHELAPILTLYLKSLYSCTFLLEIQSVFAKTDRVFTPYNSLS